MQEPALFIFGAVCVFGLIALGLYYMRLEARLKTLGIRVQARVVDREQWNTGRKGGMMLKVAYDYQGQVFSAYCQPFKGYLQYQPGDEMEAAFFPDHPDMVYKWDDVSRRAAIWLSWLAALVTLGLQFFLTR